MKSDQYICFKIFNLQCEENGDKCNDIATFDNLLKYTTNKNLYASNIYVYVIY